MEFTDHAFNTITKTIALLITFFFLVCWYFKRNSQPMKSRGIVPPICLLCFGIAVTSQLIETMFVPTREVTKPYCYIIAFGDFPFYVSLTLMMVLQVIDSLWGINFTRRIDTFLSRISISLKTVSNPCFGIEKVKIFKNQWNVYQ
jgi:hypothetical protein